MWPSAGDVDAHFPSWPQALAAAGLRPHRRTWTRETIIAALKTWATVKYVFGSWSAGLRAAGLQPALHRWTEEEVLAGLRVYVREHGRPPTARDLRDTRGTPCPPASAVIRTLGSLRSALERTGHPTAAPPPVTDDEIAAALLAYALAHAHPPTVAVWRTERRRPSASVIIRRHGS